MIKCILQYIILWYIVIHVNEHKKGDARNRNAWAMIYAYRERICRILTRTRESWVHFTTSWLKLGTLPINVSVQMAKTVASIAQIVVTFSRTHDVTKTLVKLYPCSIYEDLWPKIFRSCLIVSRSLNLAWRRFPFVVCFLSALKSDKWLLVTHYSHTLCVRIIVAYSLL